MKNLIWPLIIPLFFSLTAIGQNDVGFKATVISSFVAFKDISQ